jgi:hypothetical protein
VARLDAGNDRWPKNAKSDFDVRCQQLDRCEVRSRLVQANPPSTELQAHAQELLDNAVLENVRCTKVAARLGEGSHSRLPGDVRTRIGRAYAIGVGAFACKYEYHIEILDESEDLIAEFDLELVVDFAIADRSFTPTEGAANFVMDTTGFFGAFPYARELLQSTSARLQLNPLVFDLLDRNHLVPRGVTTVRADLSSLGSNVPGSDEAKSIAANAFT